MKIKRELILGIAGVATLLIFIWGVNFLKGTDLLQRQQRFYVVYPRTDGLIESHPVTANGVSIGQVHRIRFHPDRSGRVLVECIIGDLIDIPANTIARLTASSLIGGYEIVLHLGDDQQLLQNRDTLTGVIQPAIQDELMALIDPIHQQTGTIFARLDTLLLSLTTFFDENTRRNISYGIDQTNRSLSHLESVTRNIKQQEDQINHIIQQLSNLTDTMAELEFRATLEQTRESLAAFNQVMQSVNQGDGSISRMLHDESLYQNLEDASKQLGLLLEDVRNNPGKYFHFSVFGRK